MSMNRNDYVIVGYDFTKFKDIFYTEKWAENDENIEKWECNQIEGETQVFSDPCSGNHLYFGYVVAKNDEYDTEIAKISISELQELKTIVDEKLKQVGWNIPREPIPYEVICFTEYR